MTNEKKRTHLPKKIFDKKTVKERVQAILSPKDVCIETKEFNEIYNVIQKAIPKITEMKGKNCRCQEAQIAAISKILGKKHNCNIPLIHLAKTIDVGRNKVNDILFSLNKLKLSKLRKDHKKNVFVNSNPLDESNHMEVEFIEYNKNISCLNHPELEENLPKKSKKIVIRHTPKEIKLLKRRNWLLNKFNKSNKIYTNFRKSKFKFENNKNNKKDLDFEKDDNFPNIIKKLNIFNQILLKSVYIIDNRDNNCIFILKSSGFTPPELI